MVLSVPEEKESLNETPSLRISSSSCHQALFIAILTLLLKQQLPRKQLRTDFRRVQFSKDFSCLRSNLSLSQKVTLYHLDFKRKSIHIKYLQIYKQIYKFVISLYLFILCNYIEFLNIFHFSKVKWQNLGLVFRLRTPKCSILPFTKTLGYKY